MTTLSRDDEIDSRVALCTLARYLHRQLAAVAAVGAVAGLVRKVQLRCQNTATRRLHLDVNVARAPWVFAGDNGLQVVTSLRVGEHVPAITKTLVVVCARLVAMPEVEQCIRYRLALRREHETRQREPFGLAALLAPRVAPRRIRGEEGTRGLRRRSLGLLAAGRRQRQRLARHGADRDERQRERGAQESAPAGPALSAVHGLSLPYFLSLPQSSSSRA